MKNIYTIAKREFGAYFDSLVAFVVVAGSMFGLGLWFFYTGFWDTNRVSIATLLTSFPFALSLIVIPLLTMRSLAEEKRSGTLELLITLPVTDAEVILGKYVAALALIVVLLFVSLAYPLAMYVWPWHLGALDWGPVWAGYFGLFLFSAAGIAVGMMFSGFTDSQVIAFFMTFMTLGLLLAAGFLVEKLPGWPGDSLSFISFLSRYQPFARGLIDTRAVVYFISVAVMSLLVAFRSLESRKWS